MKCVISAGNVKILAKSIHALAKIGDEMYVQPQKKSISFRTVNTANSAYADFTFYENFCSYYALEKLEEDDALKCKISMRSAITVFKAPNTIDKQIETCHIKLEPDASELLFILKYKNSINKTYFIPVLESKKVQAAYIKDGVPNQLMARSRVLTDAVQNFQQNLIEITLEVSCQKVLLRNYVDDTTNVTKAPRTQLALDMGEFDRYIVGTETTITFCMKELRAILAFAEAVGMSIGLHFETAGRPIVFVLKNTTFEGNLVLSTLNPDVDGETDSTMDKMEKVTRKRTTSRKTSKRSKTASSSDNQLCDANRTLHNILLRTRHPAFIEDNEIVNTNRISNRAKTNTSRSSVIRDCRINSRDENQIEKESRTEEVNKEVDTSSLSTTVSIASRISDANLRLSSLSMDTAKRKFSTGPTENREVSNDVHEVVLIDTVPRSPSPPLKKARLIFQRCFQKTFDVTMLPGHDIILAEDSDECTSD